MKRIKGKNHAEILKILGGGAGLREYYADVSGDKQRPGYMLVRTWIAKNDIPVWHWGTLIDAAAAKGYRLTIQDLWDASPHK